MPAAPDHLEELQRAVIEGVQVELDYRGRDGRASSRTVHPLGLVVKNNTWYLVAETEAGQRTFRVSRVRSLRLTAEPAVRPDDFDLGEAWRAIVTTVDAQRAPVRVQLRADATIVDVLRYMFGTRVGDRHGRSGRAHRRGRCVPSPKRWWPGSWPASPIGSRSSRPVRVRHHLADIGRGLVARQRLTSSLPSPAVRPTPTAASRRPAAASSRSSLPAGPISCRLAGSGPPVGTGSDSAGTPARFTGSVQRETSRSSPSSRRGGKMLSVGVTSRSTSAKSRSSVSFQARWTPQAVRDGGLVEGTAELQPFAHAVADALRVLRHQRRIGLPGLDHQEEARLHGGVVPPRDVHLAAVPPDEAQGPVERGGDRRVRLDGRVGPTTRSAPPASATVKPGSSSSIPVTSPATVRAIGPTVSKLGASGQTPSSGMRPQVVLSPAVPQQAAGMRMEPPVSLP